MNQHMKDVSCGMFTDMILFLFFPCSVIYVYQKDPIGYLRWETSVSYINPQCPADIQWGRFKSL